MPISRTGGCQEVCQEVRSRLVKAGFLTEQDIKHTPVFEALEQCVIVRKEDLKLALISFAGKRFEKQSDAEAMGRLQEAVR